MSISLTAALNIATRSIQTNQAALSTISHNIANVNTEGYSRQIVQIGSEAIGGFGSGASVAGISRQIDQVLARRLTDQLSTVGYDDTIRTQLQNLETIFPTGASSIEKLTGDFFSALNDLANNPESAAQKQNVIQTASLITDTLNQLDNDLTANQISLDDDIDTEIALLNNFVENIYALNQDIRNIETSGVTGINSNDLRDQRQADIDEIASRLKINVISNDNGSVSIYTENGRKLLDESSFVVFSREPGSGTYDDIAVQNRLVNGELSSQKIILNTDTLTTGSLKGQIDVRDTTIANLKAELDEFAAVLADEFNKLHANGSSIPPQNSLESGNRGTITATTSDIYTEVDASLASDTFHISVVNQTTGAVVSSTKADGAGGPIALPGAGPFSLADLETLLEANADVAGDLTIDTGVDGNGDAFISITATNGSNGVVIENVTGDFAGLMKFNNFFTSSSTDAISAGNIQVSTAIQNDPNLIATARLRTDGGLSSLDNQNVIALANLADTNVSFNAAGTLGGGTETLADYGIQIVSGFAIQVDNAVNRAEFSQTVLTDIETRAGNISGVNIDEELANLLVFQNAFQASARVISVVDELFDSLLQVV